MNAQPRSPSPFPTYPLLLLVILIILSQNSSATDTLTQSHPISAVQTLISSSQVFELGFFSPKNSSKLYVGIWYKKYGRNRIVLWVANRESPLAALDSNSSLTIGDDGNLRLLDGKRNIVWSTNISVNTNNSIAILSDQGDFTLRNGVSGQALWESFSYPCDSFLPGMTIGLNTNTKEKRFLSSWRAEADPSTGEFTFGLTTESPPQAFVWKGSRPYVRGGPWNGQKLIGFPEANVDYAYEFNLVSDNQQGDIYLTVNNGSIVRFVALNPQGHLKIVEWDEEDWRVIWEAPENPCSVYGVCGPFGLCKINQTPMCECLNGFMPKSAEDWKRGNWSEGCVRRTELVMCQENHTITTTKEAKSDFWKLSEIKLPDHFEYLVTSNYDYTSCRKWCSSNCSCVAYAYVAGIGCVVWAGELVDIRQFPPSSGNDLFLRLAASELGEEKETQKLIIGFSTFSGVILLGALLFGVHKSRRNRRGKGERRHVPFHFSDVFNGSRGGQNFKRNGMTQQASSKLPIFDLMKIVAATNGFSAKNKVGEGGFGPVFRGELEDGQEIAVKKLSRSSSQGLEEFKNEIILISKLQHKNLVRLFGCCIKGEELLIVYEYMPNRSLDTFLFDPTRSPQLNWKKRFDIIQGIAKGLLYLHRDSRLKIIHRDLKASNILLDKNMNPKISDFGLARTFQATQELATTRRVAGTLGYMSPEYALGGIFSEKSDIFSFGVLVLEIVSGKRNTSFKNEEKHLSLLSYAWQLWSEDKVVDLIDQVMGESFSMVEVNRCIHVGLLCIQDHAAERPTMSDIILMLSRETNAPLPKQPAFTFQSLMVSDHPHHSQGKNATSVNEITLSKVQGR